MNTMTMANALKAVFGAQTLTTASYFPACAQDGTPSGVISAANLASVLGVYPKTIKLSKNQEVVIGKKNGGSSLVLLCESSITGTTFIGYAHYLEGLTSLFTRPNNSVTFGPESSGDVVLYYDTSIDYRLRIKYKGSRTEDLVFQYVIIE